ncbi:ALIX V-shaped domain binding to HIV-domain-containing protein [Haematococcus lacustris]
MPPAPPAAKEHVMQLQRSMAQAGDSDRGVLQRLADHELAFRRLDIDTAAMSMPRLQPPRHAVGPEEPGQVAASLRRDLDNLQGLERERAELQASLQALKDRDNILPHLLATSPQGLDRLYISELKKYEPLSFAIERNSSNQADLMARLDRDNRLFHLTFDIQGWHQQCQAASQDLRQEVGVFKDLLEHCAEGLRFYLGMAEVARRCRQECEDAAASRRMDREELARLLRPMPLQALSRNSRQAEDDVLARRLAMANLGGGQAKYPAASAAYPSSAPPDASGDSHQRKGGGLFGALLGLVTGGGGGQKQEAQQQPGYYPTAPYYQASTEQEQRPSYRATFQYSYT